MKKEVSRERRAVVNGLRAVIVSPIVLYVGFVAINHTLYEHYMREGMPFRAFLVRPFHFIRKVIG